MTQTEAAQQMSVGKGFLITELAILLDYVDRYLRTSPLDTYSRTTLWATNTVRLQIIDRCIEWAVPEWDTAKRSDTLLTESNFMQLVRLSYSTRFSIPMAYSILDYIFDGVMNVIRT